jgi:hypothetical protein
MLKKFFRRFCACHKNENWWWIQKKHLHDKKDFTSWNLILCWCEWIKWTRNVLIKQTYITIKNRNKFLFDVNDFVNVVVTTWIKNDSEFFHECMRVQMTFFILLYCFTNARIETFLRNDKKSVEQKTNENEKMMFQNLTLKNKSILIFQSCIRIWHHIRMSYFIFHSFSITQSKLF